MQKTTIYVNISMLKNIIIIDLLSEIVVLIYSVHLFLVSNSLLTFIDRVVFSKNRLL